MKKFCILWLPFLIWAAVIFMFSSQPYQKQNIRPILAEVVNPNWIDSVFSSVSISYAGKVISIDTVGTVGFLEFLARKAAHFLVFFILGWLMYRAVVPACKNRKGLSVMISFLFVSLYAASDEFHQVFTDNRTPLIQDVFLDMAGGITGIILATLLYSRIIIRKKFSFYYRNVEK